MANEDIGQRVRALRQKLDWSQAKLAKEVGKVDKEEEYSADKVRSWESGKVRLGRNQDLVAILAGIFEVETDYLMNGMPAPSVKLAQMRMVHVLGGLSAGQLGVESGDVEMVAVEDWGTQKERWGRRITGSSMQPALKEGDIAFFEECSTPEPGWIIHAYDAGSDIVKVFRRQDGQPVLVPLNEEYETIDAKNWNVRGVLVGVRRELAGGVIVNITNTWNGPLRPEQITIG